MVVDDYEGGAMRIPSCVLILPALAILGAVACSDPTSPENAGTVRIIVAVAGLDPDPDGFQVSVDGGTPMTITPPDTATIQLHMGHHTVTVSGLSANCGLNGSDTRSIAVNSAETVDVLVVVNCTALTGVIEVRTETTGLDLDPTGYMVRLETGAPQVVSANGVIRFPVVPGGSHQVDISGLEPNCSTGGAGPVDVTVEVGGLVRDTARVVIGVSCTALTGVIEVRSATTGPDQSGFEAGLDVEASQDILANGVYHFDSVPGGAHSLGFGGFAPNCTPAGLNPRQVDVAIGGPVRDTVRVTVEVTCTATTGVVQIQTSTTGFDQDPDGFKVSVDAGPEVSLPSNGVVRVAGLGGGNHTLTFSGYAPNCSAAGPNPVQVSLTVGGAVQDTALVTLNVTCTATTGVIRVRESTTGPYHDPSYLVSVDGGLATSLLTGAVVDFPGLLPGSHSVALSDVAPTCTVTSPNPVVVTAVVGDTVEVVFDISCSAAPSTGAQLVFTTTGNSRDSSYHLGVWTDCYYCETTYFDGSVAANGAVVLSLPPGPYIYVVDDVASNCVGPSYGGFTTIDQQLTTVALNYDCAPMGTIVVSPSVTGPDPDSTFYVTVDGVYRAYISDGGSVSLPTLVGSRQVGLEAVATNCAVTGPNPVPVPVANDSTTHVAFPVSCQANPLLQVTVTTTGPNAPASYLVGVDPEYYWYTYQHTAGIPANGGVSLALLPGSHYVTLDQVPLNCVVTSPNNVTVTMTLGIATNLAFTVVCH